MRHRPRDRSATGYRAVWSVKRATVPYTRERPALVGGDEAAGKTRVRASSGWVLARCRGRDPRPPSPWEGRDHRVNGDRWLLPPPPLLPPKGEQGHCRRAPTVTLSWGRWAGPGESADQASSPLRPRKRSNSELKLCLPLLSAIRPLPSESASPA